MIKASNHHRYIALDVFRGITICFMIIVNSPGNWSIAYAPLLHASWHGFTPTDLVFPSFMFAVGNAMAFAMQKYETQGQATFWRKTVTRTLVIFLLGYLMYWFPFVETSAGHWHIKPIANTRILGVLQRIAIAYFITAAIMHVTSKKFACWFSVLALVSYWIIMSRYGDSNDLYSLVGNAALKLDLYLLGGNHLYHGEGIAFDPEGILSTLPAIVNVIAGYLAGDFIRKQGNSFETMAKLMMTGGLLILGACTWNMTFPINKKLWTSSFVLLTVGLDLFILPTLIYLVEFRNKNRWTDFFMVFGKNPLFIYLLSELLLVVLYMIPVGDASLQTWLYANVLCSFASPILASFLFAFFFMLTCWAVGYLLDKKKIYIKV